jgi:hypothetical protein
MIDDDVVIRLAVNLLHIGVANYIVRGRTPGQENTTYPLERQLGLVFAALIRRERRRRTTNEYSSRVFAASIADIEKALAPKKKSDPKDKLPRHYH